MSRPRWMVYCPSCDGRSLTTYRCDNVVDVDQDGEPIECGRDLVDEPTVPFRWPSDFGERTDDGLVRVRFRRICVACDAERWLPLEFADVGDPVWFGCVDCGEVTRHRPSDEDVRYFPDGKSLAQPDDQTPPVSTGVA